MKNSYSFWALIAVSFLFAFSCQKNEVALEDEHPSEKSFRTITLNFPTDPETKVSLAEDGKTAWEENDEILIHGAKVGKNGDVYYSRIITLKSENIHNSGKTATFTLEDIEADAGWGRSGYKATLFAAYPASALIDYTDGDSWYYSSAWDQTNTLLMAGTNDTSVNDGNTFTFTHLTGVLSFVVSGDFDSYIFSGKSGTEVVGYDVFSVRVDTQSKFGDKNKIPYNGGSGGVGFSGEKTSITAPVVSDGSTINYIYFPGGVNLANGFTIQFMKGGIEQKRIETNTAKNIERGKYLKLGDVTAYLHTYVPPATHDATNPAIAGAYDLGATNGTANCYLLDSNVGLEANKVYKFKAYQGNGTSNVGKISSVGVLWETYNDSNAPTANSIIAAVDYDKQSKNEYYEITFKMPATIHAGNAVIVAKDNSDKILWSWHIWVPSSDVSSVDVSKICGSKLMDRNLGALEPVSTAAGTSVYSLGMFYEWGRKDPFLGPKRVENGAGYALVAGTAPSVLSGSTMTIAETIKNPTQYASDGISDMDFTKWAKTKTIYDPCPPGYKLPYVDRSSSNPFTNSDLSTSLPAKGYGWESSTTGYWFKFSDGDNAVVFPLAGYVEEGLKESYYSYKNTIRAAVWYLCDSSSSPYHLNIRPSESTNAFGSTNLRRGCNVRCCVIE